MPIEPPDPHRLLEAISGVVRDLGMLLEATPDAVHLRAALEAAERSRSELAAHVEAAPGA